MNEAERFGDQMLVAYSAVRQRGIIAGIAGKLEPECREGQVPVAKAPSAFTAPRV
jgi:hypothetical protein